MREKARTVPEGTITSPRGFMAGATYAGLKTPGPGVLDVALLYSQAPCLAVGLFTSNRVKAAPVLLCQRHLEGGKAQGIVVNSGCANACTGEQGLEDAHAMAALAAQKLGVAEGAVLAASTGVIGVNLPMEKLRAGIPAISLSPEGGRQFARAICTTDTFPKERAVQVELGGKVVTIGGVAKGAGMIHPNLATMLAFVATDAAVEPGFLRRALQRAATVSFNMVTVDGDTSTNDTLLLLANGQAGNCPIGGGAEGRAFLAALEEVCIFLARCIARDGEGATKAMEVTVEGAQTQQQARTVARTVAGSPLVKAALHGNDPNWGRILAAAGRSGAKLVEARTDVYLQGYCLMKGGHPQPFDKAAASASLDRPEVSIKVSLNLGRGRATAWGCDLSEEYVTFNSAYTT